MRVLILIYLIVLISLSSCASTQTKGKVGSQEGQLESGSGQPFVIPAIPMDGKKVGDLVLGQTTLNQALQIMPPWPGHPPMPLRIDEFEKANPGLLESFGKVGEVLRKVKKSYNPMKAMYILFFDKNEKLVIVQRDFSDYVKEEREEIGKIYDEYQHQLREVYRDSQGIRMQGQIQPCITLEIMLNTMKAKSGEPFRTGYVFTCPTK